MNTSKYFPTIEAIDKASEVLGEILDPTPFMKNNNLSDVYDANVFLKREDLQIVRSYKIRGAYNKIRSIDPETLKYGIVCASAGNHAQGVALAATKNGIKSLICLPDSAPISKVEATKGFGADVCLVEGCYDDAYQRALELKETC